MRWLAQTAADVEPGRLIVGAPDWVVPAAILAAIVVAIVVWNYLRGRVGGGIAWIAGALKIVAVALIAFCLLEPLRSGERPRPQANVMPIMVDNSISMTLADDPGGTTRGEQVAAMVDPESAWRTRLEQDFDVRTYQFDARLRATDDFETLRFDGVGSTLGGSLQSLAERFTGRPVGGALLFTDGNATDEVEWSELGFPVYPVVADANRDLRDLRIDDVSIRQTDFESAPVTINVSLAQQGLDRQETRVRLTDLNSERVIEERSVTLPTGDNVPEPIRFRFRPEGPGIGFFRVDAFLSQEKETFDDGETESEATLANNSRQLAVERASGPYRILYVAGRPNWEFKFLRRSLDEDAEVQLVGLLRIAKEEPKFSFRDRGVNTTNPLFAGLGDDEEEAAEQYDEPVIVRLGVRESEELSDGFPLAAEELFAYHGLILDDLEPEFFTQDQMLLIRRFVAARGGGLLMLGGKESYAGKRFGDSPLGELSPAYAASSADANPSGEYRLELTREGMLQPWVRLRETEAAEAKRLEGMPPFLSVNALGSLKPGASLLATARDLDGREAIALAAQRFGKGRAAAMPITDLWRWSMRRELPSSQIGIGSRSGAVIRSGRGPADEADPANADHESFARNDPAQAWRQIVHWLVNEVPRRAEVRVDTPPDPGKPVRIVATARDEAYLPLDNARVRLHVTPLGGEPFTLRAEPIGDQPGVYQASYWAPEMGCYRVEAEIDAPDGSEVGTAVSGWSSDPSAAEFRSLRVDRERLARIAEQTGGELVSAAQIDAFVEDLPNRKVPMTETWVYPVWHHTWVMLAAMLCLCGEWGLRRWKGLP